MKILLDADGSPVRKETVEIARQYRIPLYIISNVNHVIDEPYGKIVMVDHDPDAADFKILSITDKDSLVITQDYGLASLALAKEASVLHHNGWFFSNDNMEYLLNRRHLNQKARKKGARPPSEKPRSEEQNIQFKTTLESFVKERMTPNG